MSFRRNTFRSNSSPPLYFLDRYVVPIDLGFETLTIILACGLPVFSSFRAYALSGRNIVIGGLVLILNTGFVVVTIVSSYHMFRSPRLEELTFIHVQYPWAVTTITADCNFQLPQSHALTVG